MKSSTPFSMHAIILGAIIFQLAAASANEVAGGSNNGASAGVGWSYGAVTYDPLTTEYKKGDGISQARMICPGSGSFTWLYPEPPPPKCSRQIANTEFYAVINRSFNKCVAQGSQAAGISSDGGNFKGEVIHGGFVGDDRHQASNSLHNVGRAVDIKKIKVNGTLMDFSKAAEQFAAGDTSGKEYKFFLAFRECWGREARAADRSCANAPSTKAGYFGNVGWEDEDHQHHLHISLPLCDQQGFKIALLKHQAQRLSAFWQLISEAANATDYGKPDKIRLRLASGEVVSGEAKFVGEPVSEPVVIKMNIQCRDKSTKILERRLSVCDYVALTQDKNSQKILLTTTSAIFDEEEGRHICGDPITKSYENPCPN